MTTCQLFILTLYCIILLLFYSLTVYDWALIMHEMTNLGEWEELITQIVMKSLPFDVLDPDMKDIDPITHGYVWTMLVQSDANHDIVQVWLTFII